jgi:hypothetical protein
MGVINNIKASIDDKSSMSVNSITLLAYALMGAIVGLVMCFVLVYDVIYDGKVDTDMGDMAMLLMSSGVYILGSGAPKAYVDSRMKTRSWVENEKLQIEAEEDVEDYRSERRRKRRNKDQIVDVEGNIDAGSEDNLDNE